MISDDDSGDEVAITNREFKEVEDSERCIFPNNCIGRLQICQKAKMYQGTAFLVSPDEALSVAHNFPKNIQSATTTKTLYLFCNNKEQAYDVASVKINKRYFNKLSNQDKYIFDYCLIKLKKKVTFITKFLEIQPNFGLDMKKEDLAKYQLGICGFPLGYQNRMMHCYYLTSVSEITDYGILKHYLPTEKGHSGCPIMIKREGMIKVIGIHKGGGQEYKTKQNVNYGRIFSKIQYDFLTEMLWDLSQWSKSENTGQHILANHPVIKNLPKRQQLTFCDPLTKDFKQFNFQSNKITLKSGQSGWKRLFSKRKICSKNCIYIKNISLPPKATICFGFVSQNFKKAEATCNFSGFKKDYIGMMVTSTNNTLKGEIGISHTFNQDFTMDQKDDMYMEIELGKLSEDPQKNTSSSLNITTKRTKDAANEKRNLVKINLKDNIYNFTEDTIYYFYVSMCTSGTSVEIQM